MSKPFKIMLAAVLALAATSAIPAMAADGPTTRPHTHEGDVKYPAIQEALTKLRAARDALQKAEGTFGGHKEAALKDIRDAIHELELANKGDRN